MTLYPQPKPALKPIVQVDLRSGDRLMTAWVNKHPNLKEGVWINLEGIVGLWKVLKIYPRVHEATDFDWHRKWDNNI
jgi:hypothetical protein